MLDPEAHALSFRSQMKTINQIDFHIVEAGQGPPLVFLHGFPEYWGTWQALMADLARDYRCVAPDLRGYGLTAKPVHRSAYQIETLIRDGLGILDLAERHSPIVVAHDWGATLAFYLAMQAPNLVKHLIILNGAHPYVLQDHIWDNPEQRRASQYMASLMSDTGAHELNASNAVQIAKTWLSEPLETGKLSPAQYQRFLDLWSVQSNWDAMINWYRASGFSVPAMDAPAPRERWTDALDGRVECPVTMIWGAQDPVFSSCMLQDLAKICSTLEIHTLRNTGHVPHRDEPDKCIEIIRECAARAFDEIY